MDLIWQSFYLILPAYFANVSAGLFQKSKFLSTPLDHSKKIGPNYILGPGKTYRGTLIGITIAVLTVFFQKLLFSVEVFHNISIIDYQQINWLSLGLLAGIGSMGGDIVASFFKRRLKLKRGAPAPLLDQWDYIIGFLLLTSLIVSIPSMVIITVFLMTLVIHPSVNIIAYHLKLKKVWW